jgi:hypothetical protein
VLYYHLFHSTRGLQEKTNTLKLFALGFRLVYLCFLHDCMFKCMFVTPTLQNKAHSDHIKFSKTLNNKLTLSSTENFCYLYTEFLVNENWMGFLYCYSSFGHFVASSGWIFINLLLISFYPPLIRFHQLFYFSLNQI